FDFGLIGFSQPTQVPQRSGDRWQRMKECAQQTDRMTKQAGWVAGKREGILTILGWQNHYSEKYERCYVQVNYANHAAEQNRDLAPVYDELFDAFEGKLLAICTDAKTAQSPVFCSIQDDDSPRFDCGACRRFVKDRMER